MERRSFIKSTCTACLLLGTGSLLSTLASCSSTAVFKVPIVDDQITIPLALFDQAALQIVRPHDYEYDVAVRKNTDGKYIALLMQCTHADNGLMSTGNGYTCNLHGSNFDNNGAVTKGPAERPLKKLQVVQTNNNITIKLNTQP